MRIVTINVHYQDGLGYQDYYLCREFIKMGHEVIQIASDRHFPFPNYESTVEPIIGPRIIGTGIFYSDFGMPIHRLPTSFVLMGKIWMKGLKKKLAELQPDLIFCHGVFNAYSYRVAQYAAGHNVPVIYDDHTTANFVNTSLPVKIITRFFRLIATPLIQKTALRVVAISDSVKPYLQHTLGFTAKVQTIGLGADTDIFYPDEAEGKALKTALNIPDDHLLITYTGKIYKDKLLEQIPAAIAQLGSIAGKLTLLFVGPVADDYKEQFDAILNNTVVKTIYHKSVPPAELRKFYNASDICCWPAHATGSTVDASACGKPIICNEMMGERYAYGNGIGVQEGNTEQLKQALEKLLSDKPLREQMGKLGIRYIDEKLSWQAIARQFLANV